MTASVVPDLGLDRVARHRQQAERPQPVAAPPHPLLRLQRQAGNAAVTRLVQRLQDGAVQRNGDKEDDDMLQAKHDRDIQRVGQGADEEMVMGAHDEGSREGAVGLEGGALPADAAGRIDAMRGVGSTLDDTVRAAAEPALGVDLSPVRVHQDSASDSLARGMTAKAFTSGSDIFLREDVNASDSRLMAHELTHVAQQASGGVAAAGQRMTVGPADDPLEHEADRVADAVTSGAAANREIDDR
ncbi:MAG: DUF4157 domain-containing protein [Dehalococcoidia bacterium]